MSSQNHTVGWLIATLKDYEAAQAEEAQSVGAAPAGSPEAIERVWRYQERQRLAVALGTAQDLDRIRLLCDEIDTPGLTAANVTRLRAKVCRAKPCALEEADALSLAEAADVLDALVERPPRPQPSGQVETPPSPTGQPVTGRPKKEAGVSVNDRMAAMLNADPVGRLWWTATEWATQLTCTPAAVKQTKMWKETIRAARALYAADGATRKRKETPGPKGRRR
ncbi:MAG: hypothetical protein U0797_26340 [Gemmataceae bacterium]